MIQPVFGRTPLVALPLSALLVSALSLPVTARAQRGGGGSDAAPSPASSVTRAPRGPRAMLLSDWYRVANVSTPAVSPDGKRIAMTVTTAKEAENRRHSEIWVANTAGGEP